MKTIPLLAVLVTASLTLPAQAIPLVETDQNTSGGDVSYESAYDSLIQNNDLLTYATITSNGVSPDIGTSYTGINDGAAYSGGDASASTYFGTGLGGGTNLEQNPVVTFTLDTSVNTAGYTITSINSIYGWQNFPSLSDQNYTISYSTDGVNFSLLTNVQYIPFDPAGGGGDPATQYNSSDVNLSDITGLVGVKALRFAFTAYSVQNGQMIREIDVDGTPTEVPEPSSYAMLLAGLAVLGLCVRRKGFSTR